MELEYIYTDINYNELGYLTHFDADIEIGKYDVSKNDFGTTSRKSTSQTEISLLIQLLFT